MIQDIFPFSYKVEYDPAVAITAGDFVLPFNGQNITVIDESPPPPAPAPGAAAGSPPAPSGPPGPPGFPPAPMKLRYIKYEELKSPQVSFRYLFGVLSPEGELARYFLPEAPLPEECLPEGHSDKPTFIFNMLPEKYLSFVGITAHSLYLWYDSHKFCGKCGTPNNHSETERAVVCPNCGTIRYPQISPVVIVAVLNGDKILLTRYKNRGPGFYALVAGFVETGEMLEDAVRREVLEETGIHVKNVRYYKSQPWGFSSSLLNGFFCDLDGDETIHVDNIELSEGVWLTPAEIEQRDTGIALTAEMIELFRSGNAPRA